MIKDLEVYLRDDFDALGPEFRPVFKKFLTWVCDNVEGDRVLIFDSSNGIISYLLANINKIVTIVTDDNDTLNDINSRLEKIGPGVQSNIVVERSNLYEFIERNRFDTVIINDSGLDFNTEIVQNKVFEHLSPGSRLVITRPFGLFGDELTEGILHYGWDLLPLFSRGVDVESLELIGSESNLAPYYWLCVSFNYSGEVDNAKPSTLNLQFLKDIELKLSEKEKGTLRSLKKVKEDKGRNEQRIKEANRLMADELIRSISALSGIGRKLDPVFSINLQESMNELDVDEAGSEDPTLIRTRDDLLPEEGNVGDLVIQLQQENEQLRMKLEESIAFIERELKEEERLVKSYSELNKKYEKLDAGYRSLSHSLPTKASLMYWNFLKNKKTANRRL